MGFLSTIITDAQPGRVQRKMANRPRAQAPASQVNLDASDAPRAAAESHPTVPRGAVVPSSLPSEASRPEALDHSGARIPEPVLTSRTRTEALASSLPPVETSLAVDFQTPVARSERSLGPSFEARESDAVPLPAVPAPERAVAPSVSVARELFDRYGFVPSDLPVHSMEGQTRPSRDSESRSGAETRSASERGFNKSSSRARAASSAERPARPVESPRVHIGQIDVIVMQEAPPAPQPAAPRHPEGGAFASRHQVRRL